MLGAILAGQERLGEAEDALEEALRLWQSHYGPNHYEISVTLHNLAAIHAARGDHVRADTAYARALAIKCRILGPSHPEVVALRSVLRRIHA